MALVLIDPGHGGRHPTGGSSPYGTRGPAGTVEKEVNLRLARKIQRRLGQDAALTRVGDQNPSLADRASGAGRCGARVFLSLHSNAGSTTELGSQSWVHPTAQYGSRALAQRLQHSLARFGGGRSGVMSADLGVLRPRALGRNVDACLLEVDYLSNPARERLLQDPAHLDRIATAIAGAVREHLAYGRRVSARALDPLEIPSFDWSNWRASLSELGRWLVNRIRFEAFPVENTQIYPYNAICKLTMSDGGMGTGFFIGPNTILTAGHCTVDGSLNPIGRINVQVGLDGGANAIASFDVLGPDIIAHPSYDGGQDFDIGLLRTGTNRSDYYFDIEEQVASPQGGIAICGYAYGEDRQRIDSDSIRDVHAETYSYSAETRGGTSGSPVFYVDGELAVATGVHINSRDAQHPAVSGEVNVGCRLTQDKLVWIRDNAGSEGVVPRPLYGKARSGPSLRLQGPVRRSQPNRGPMARSQGLLDLLSAAADLGEDAVELIRSFVDEGVSLDAISAFVDELLEGLHQRSEAFSVGPGARALDDGVQFYLGQDLRPLEGWQARLLLAVLGAYLGNGTGIAGMIVGAAGIQAVPEIAAMLDVTIGIGPALQAAAGVGVSPACGLVFDPDHRVGIYGSIGAVVGFTLSAAVSMQLTVVAGHVDVFSGQSLSIGGTLGAPVAPGVSLFGGVHVIVDDQGQPVGATVEVGASGGPLPVEFYMQVIETATTIPQG